MIPLFAEMSIFSTKLTRKTANCVENNKYINIIIFRKLYVKMQQHSPRLPLNSQIHHNSSTCAYSVCSAKTPW